MKNIFLLILFATYCLTPLKQPSAANPFPLIIMGGRWTESKKSGYSDISRVCNAGFTHVSSYFTESLIGSNIELEKMINKVEEFSRTVLDNCPKMGLVVGVPRRWIYENRRDLISKYISEISMRNIAVDYWYSDEMIFQMVKKGLNLDEAVSRAISAIQAVRSVSNTPYIWNEPGNYSNLTRKILTNLSQFKEVVKAFDEYVISKKGKLNITGLYGILSTMRLLKSDGIERVFPVIEINLYKDRVPTKDELATILFSLAADGADGIIFYEERRTTLEVLDTLKDLNPVLTSIAGTNDFKKVYSDPITIWKSKAVDGTIEVILNTQKVNIDPGAFIKEKIIPLWPEADSDVWRSLDPLGVLIFKKANRQ